MIVSRQGVLAFTCAARLLGSLHLRDRSLSSASRNGTEIYWVSDHSSGRPCWRWDQLPHGSGDSERLFALTRRAWYSALTSKH